MKTAKTMETVTTMKTVKNCTNGIDYANSKKYNGCTTIKLQMI